MSKPPAPSGASSELPSDDWMTAISDLLAEDKPFAEDSLHDVVAWQNFVKRTPPSQPRLVTRADLDAMTAEEKQRYDRARRVYHMGFGPLNSRAMERIHKELGSLTVDNLRSLPGARSGAIIDGAGTLGKSTIILQLGRKYELLMQKSYQQSKNGHVIEAFIPVVYTYVPSSTTTKKMLTSLVEFYGVPVGKRDTEAEIMKRLMETARACKTSLIILDDIHNLHSRNKSAASVNDLLKELMDKIPATFVYAGINTERSVLMLDTVTSGPSRASQTQNRYSLHRVRPFPYDVMEGEGSEWLEILRTIESHLLLVDYEPGWLERHYLYLYARTAGGIGALMRLLRHSTNNAIRSGIEKLRIEDLDDVRLAEGPTRYYANVKGKLDSFTSDPAALRAFLESDGAA